MAPDVELRFNGAQQIFIPFDLEIRMQTALEQNARAAQIERLLNFLEDRFMGQDVPFLVPMGR